MTIVDNAPYGMHFLSLSQVKSITAQTDLFHAKTCFKLFHVFLFGQQFATKSTRTAYVRLVMIQD